MAADSTILALRCFRFAHYWLSFVGNLFHSFDNLSCNKIYSRLEISNALVADVEMYWNHLNSIYRGKLHWTEIDRKKNAQDLSTWIPFIFILMKCFNGNCEIFSNVFYRSHFNIQSLNFIHFQANLRSSGLFNKLVTSKL